jgi:septal ring factor EnvC (AmiA/AmiB activator)
MLDNALAEIRGFTRWAKIFVVTVVLFTLAATGLCAMMIGAMGRAAESQTSGAHAIATVQKLAESIDALKQEFMLSKAERQVDEAKKKALETGLVRAQADIETLKRLLNERR